MLSTIWSERQIHAKYIYRIVEDVIGPAFDHYIWENNEESQLQVILDSTIFLNQAEHISKVETNQKTPFYPTSTYTSVYYNSLNSQRSNGYSSSHTISPIGAASIIHYSPESVTAAIQRNRGASTERWKLTGQVYMFKGLGSVLGIALLW